MRTASLVAALLVLAWAAPSAADAGREADELFQKGRAHYDAGRFEEACAALAKSQALDPSIGTLGLLAACEEKRGQLARAYEDFIEAARLARAAHDKREKVASERAAALGPKVPRLVIRVDPKRPPARVTRGGKEVDASSFGAELRVDPGPTEIVAIGPGGIEYRRTVALAEGQRIEVELPPFADVSLAATPPPERQPVARTFAWITGGVGLGGLAVGGIAGAMAIAKKGQIGKCDPAAPKCDASDAAMLSASLSTGAFVAGAALVATSAVLFVVSRPTQPKPATSATPPFVSIGLSPGGALTLSGRF